MTIILINGAKRSGKDYTATMIAKKLEKMKINVKIMSFAYSIKAMMSTLFDISMDELEILKNEETELCTANKKITDFRTILQRFGTEVCKPHFGDSIWADLLMSKVSNVPQNTDVILVPDFRFIIESEVVKSGKYNVITLHIKNDSISYTDTHSSERELDYYSFDYEIDNTNYNSQLNLKVEKFIQYCLLKREKQSV